VNDAAKTDRLGGAISRRGSSSSRASSSVRGVARSILGACSSIMRTAPRRRSASPTRSVGAGGAIAFLPSSQSARCFARTATRSITPRSGAREELDTRAAERRVAQVVCEERCPQTRVGEATTEGDSSMVGRAQGNEAVRVLRRGRTRMFALPPSRPGREGSRACPGNRVRVVEAAHSCGGLEVRGALRQLPHEAPLGRADFVVGVTGLEPATPASQTQCATKLRYTPYAFGYPTVRVAARADVLNGRRR
jgi:hypothetical protein